MIKSSSILATGIGIFIGVLIGALPLHASEPLARISSLQGDVKV